MKGTIGTVTVFILLVVCVYLIQHYKASKLTTNPMKKGIYVIIAILLFGLVVSFWFINNQQTEINSLKQSVADINKPRTIKPVVEDIESEVYDLKEKVEALENSDNEYKIGELESRIDDVDANLDELFRYSHSH